MSYKEKPILKLYKYENSSFVIVAQIDDYEEVSWENNLYEAGEFSVTINYNIPNASLFERGLFINFGNTYEFGEILKIQDSVGEEGAGSQLRVITGYDARYLLKRRVIKNTNSNGLWVMTGKGELVMRNLISDQAGINAEEKRRLPIVNNIPAPEDALGKVYSVSESFSNLYEVCKTIATQSEVGWRIEFDGENLNLVFFSGEDRSQSVRFDTNYESLRNGTFTDSSESFSNAIYVGGKGQNDNRDIYEGENAISGEAPAGLDRFECWDNQSSMTTESEYEAEALSMLTQYGQTLTLSGNGLAKCPYEYEKEYNVGDKITVAFSGKSAVVQILSVTEHWAWASYDIQFSFGKPQPDLNAQLQLILRNIQRASDKSTSKDSVRWYTIPTDTEMPPADITYNTIGFIGDCGANGATFQLYLDDEGTGAKTYHVYFKQLAGSTLTLTTGKPDATNLTLNSGTYVAIIYVDENGNITTQGTTITNAVEQGNFQAVSSDAVYQAIESGGGGGSGIKVFDTEQEIIDDLPNLNPLDIVAYKASKDPKSGVPLGTWASFENDSAPNGEWLGAGAFDANTYPALAMMLGGNTVPQRFDHNRLGDVEDVKTFFSTGGWNTNKTIPYDGFLEVSSYGNSNDSICYVNDTQIFRWYASGSIISSESYLVPVRKGDNVRFSAYIDVVHARYYTHPLFIKATPTSSDSDYEGTLNAIRTYVENNAVRTKVWIKQKNTTAQAINLVGIVIPNASKVTSLGFATIHRAGQYDPMQYYFVDLPNTSSFVMGIGEFNVNPTINGTYDSTNDTWTITSVSGVSSTYWCQFCANYGQQIIETN